MASFNPELKAELEAKVEQLQAAADREFQKNEGSKKWHAAMQEIRLTKSAINKIGETFEVGDGASSGGNGDSYPYRVVKVSKSGKTVWMRPMGYRATEEGKRIGYGHESWEVYDLPEDPDEQLIEVTFRKATGKWAQKGTSSKKGFGNFGHGARYSYNWSF